MQGNLQLFCKKNEDFFMKKNLAVLEGLFEGADTFPFFTFLLYLFGSLKIIAYLCKQQQ